MAANDAVMIDNDLEESITVLASHIALLSSHTEALFESGLNRKAIVALLHDKTKLSKKVIDQVLDALVSLRETYCTAEETE